MVKIQKCYGIGQGLLDLLPPPKQMATAPTSGEMNYSVGQIVFTPGPSAQNFYIYAGAGNWVLFASGSGDIISILGTTNQIAVSTTSGVATISLPAAIVTPGSLTTTTSLTATLGNITATNGNLVLGTAGNKLVSTSVGTTIAAGANSIGSVTLTSGTATVSTTSVTASSLIMIWRQSSGASTALGQLTVGTIVAGTSFVINAATQATPGTPLATDASVVGYMIIN